MRIFSPFLKPLVCTIALFGSIAVSAQTPPAPPAPASADAPSIKIGATIFADFTYVAAPASKDSDGNTIHPDSFNVSRAYLNVTGQLNHYLSFRITPDIARETGSGSSLNGSQTFRLKYAFAQLNLDDWTTKGSWVRLGLPPTPLPTSPQTSNPTPFPGGI